MCWDRCLPFHYTARGCVAVRFVSNMLYSVRILVKLNRIGERRDAINVCDDQRMSTDRISKPRMFQQFLQPSTKNEIHQPSLKELRASYNQSKCKVNSSRTVVKCEKYSRANQAYFVCFGLRVKVCTSFEPNMARIFTRNIKIYD